jgi:translation initiation factor 2 subunit 1
MSERKAEYPEIGDLIIATIETVTTYGAYAKLDEYNKRGLLHVSEISSSWIRNIHDFVREGQKMVLKVLRVDVEKDHIDLSLRRVTKRERIEKIKFWKKDRKADALLKAVTEKVGLTSQEVYEKAVVPIEMKYALYDGFEKAAIEGPEALVKIGVPEDIAKVFAEVAKERIHVKLVKVRGTLEIRVLKPNGVKIIKDAFLNGKEAEKTDDSTVVFYVIAAPKYSVEVSAPDWKRAEDVLQKVADSVVKNVTKAGGTGSFKREK